ncbi:hypothetical protein TNCV_4023581 [Trichonephila clavipes]|nr:hypothetical protein TNCV_4023581 [Trichonephila clavipes]
MDFMRNDQPFASHSYHAIGGNVCSGYFKMSTGRGIDGGLFSLRMSPGLASKVVVGVFSFEENMEHVFILNTTEKEIHTHPVVSVFGVVSLWMDVQTSTSSPVGMLMFLPIKMRSLVPSMRALMLDQ